MRLLFVYGTLKRGQRAHELLSGATLVRNARAIGFALVDTGAFPAMVREEGEVEGELYEVPDENMPAIDAWEDHPHLFERTEITLACGTRAESYLGKLPIARDQPRMRSWP